MSATVSPRASMCRLCLNKDELIYTFDDRLANGHQLRMCILLCTGVQIKDEDHITKMVCHKCCSLAVKLYQYRQTALANDKALKEIASEPFEEPPTNKDTILELHNSILENISQCKVSENVAQVYRVPLDDITQVNNDDKVTKDDVNAENEDASSNSTHDTVKKIFQYFPTAIVPREILDSNVLPSVPIDRDAPKYTRSEYEVTPADNSDGRVLKFKRKYPATDVVKLAVKRPRQDVFPDYFSDSDSSIPPVFKSRKKYPNIESDASYSDCDSDVPDTRAKSPPPPPSPENKPTARPSRSKVSKNPLQFPDSDSDNEVSNANKKPTNTKYCEICDRTFWGWSQLKSHQRTHLKCLVCRIICDSQEDLEYHVKNICYKNIEINQPYLALPKVDEDYFMFHKYRDAFERYFKDIEEGVYGPAELPPPPDPDYPLYHTEERILAEAEHIRSMFEKYKDLDNTPIARNKVSQTRRAETHIKYYSRNQIVLQDMYKDLTMYKVPINVVVNPRVSAHISFASKPRMKEALEKWSVDEIIDTVVKQKDPTFFLRPKKPPPPITKAPGSKITNRAASKQEKHPKLMKALTAGTSTATATTSTVTTSTSTANTVEKGKSYNIAKLLSTTTPSQINVPKNLMSSVKQPKASARISNELSLLAKQTAQKSIPNNSNSNNTTPVYANIMFRLPITTQSNSQQLNLQRPIIQQPPPQRPPQRAPVQHHHQQQQQAPPPQQQQAHLPYIKEEPDILAPLTPQPEMPPTPPKLLPPQHIPPPAYPNIPFKLPTPPIHNQNDLYLKQEKDIEDNLNYGAQAQMNRSVNGPGLPYPNHSYRMPLTKPPPPHMNYNQQAYPTQAPRFRPPERRSSNVLNSQQYYSVNHHQNGMRYRSVSGGNMMVLPPNNTGNQEGSLLSQIPPPPNLNPMPATHLLQSMNHMSNNIGHRSPINHHSAQQNHMNSMYMNSPKQPTIGKMSPISSVPSPIHSVPSPINTNPINSPINSMPPPINNNYNNNTYNTNPSLYDHSYADTYSSTAYPESYSSTYLPPQQYIPPYSPHSHMDIDPFVDQMLQRAAGTDSKMALRVKQPWELNQV